VERWGSDPSKGVFLTVMNTTDSEQSCQVSFDQKDTVGCRVTSLPTGKVMGQAPDVQLKLAGHGVEALRVEPK
jgi:hypothetical protein